MVATPQIWELSTPCDTSVPTRAFKITYMAKGEPNPDSHRVSVVLQAVSESRRRFQAQTEDTMIKAGGCNESFGELIEC